MVDTRVDPAVGGRTILDHDATKALATALRGRLIRPGDADYDEARAVHNAMVDRRPAAIARCYDAADVIAAVKYGRDSGLLVAVRGGGHNGAGLGTVDGGLVIDLSLMRGVRVDPPTRTVRVEGGCTWGDVDHATHPFGLAAVSGIISTTGVGGLTLGGGHGYLTRKYGLTIDNLLEVDLVLADGRFVTASEAHHPDLFWAVRGGGGNFGVATSFLFRLHPVSTVIAGQTLWPMEQAADVLAWYRDFMPAATEDLSGFFAFLTVPPVAPFPDALHGQTMCGVVWCYAGPPERADAVFRPVQRAGRPAFHAVQPMPYPVLQSAFDALYPPGMQWYWSGGFVQEIPDEAIERHLEFAHRLPTMQSTMHLYPIGGAAQRVGRNDTAFSNRDASWSMVIIGRDPDPAHADEITAWTRAYTAALRPFSMGGAYVNFMMEEGQERVRATYRDNYERLTRIKARYDPNNCFRVNQNIHPAR
jgi:FAD/FMN-containing dehydrogenase